jgi:hypothetical protein
MDKKGNHGVSLEDGTRRINRGKAILAQKMAAEDWSLEQLVQHLVFGKYYSLSGRQPCRKF